TSPRFAGFSRELALEENLAKRVMEEHRAKATMVFHRLRSGGSMEKIVPKGDFFHRFANLRWAGFLAQMLMRSTKLSATTKLSTEHETPPIANVLLVAVFNFYQMFSVFYFYRFLH
ncbi:hypothetical protein, partial [Flavobacterium psychrophilum]|uniref:hypothetical protein n=3 Tax=Flavobacterium psychrophilum TaxID=96345 RepID=UPI001D097E99